MINKKDQQPNPLLDKIENLPPQLKDAIFSDVNADKMFEIGKKHGLLIDKFGDMAHETGMLMLGITHPNEFVGNLAERLGISREKAKQIADDINREIFAPVREHLRGMFGKAPQAVAPETPPEPEKKPETNYGADSMNYEAKEKTSLEDLEAELRKELAGEQKPQNMEYGTRATEQKGPEKPKQPHSTFNVPPSTHDPYREPVEDTLPNVPGIPSQPTRPQPHNENTGTQTKPTEQKTNYGAGSMNYGNEKTEQQPTSNDKKLESGPLSKFRGMNMGEGLQHKSQNMEHGT